MEINRRSFLGGIAIAAGVATSPIRIHAKENRKPLLRFGILTDTHIGTYWMLGINVPAVEKALRNFREREVDAVMICGDITDAGTIAQLRTFAEVWERVFPKGKGKNGKTVEKLLVTGNHDIQLWKPVEKQGPNDIAPQIEKVWMEVLNEKFEPVFTKVINGFTFVGANWDSEKAELVGPVLDRVMKNTPPGKPVFYFQHAPHNRTCYGSWPKDPNDSRGNVGKLLEKYPNVIAFSGHTHKAITNPRSIWQGDYTAIHAGVVTWVDFPPHTWPKDLPEAACYAKNDCILTVYPNEIVIERNSISFGYPLGPDWTLPLPLKKETFPYTTEKQLAAAKAPAFAPSAKAWVNLGMGPDSLGQLPPDSNAVKGKKPCILVSFPAAELEGEDDLVMRYEISAIRTDTGKEVARKDLFTEFYLGKTQMKGFYNCLIEQAPFPVGVPCRVIVKAIDFYDLASKPIQSDPFTLAKRG